MYRLEQIHIELQWTFTDHNILPVQMLVFIQTICLKIITDINIDSFLRPL